MKKCKLCNRMLPYEKFTKSKNVKDGYENTCKECRIEQRKKYINICINCGKEFKTAYKNSKYCSAKCKPQCQKDRVKVKCFICGKEKEITESHKNMYKHFYCSEECKNKGYSILYSKKNSARYTSKEYKCYICGKKVVKNNYTANKYEHFYCSKECKQKGFSKLFSGKNNPNYNKDKSQEERENNRNIEGYNEWRRKVFLRDNFKCRCCGDDKGGNLVAHHIFNYMEFKKYRVRVINGITLCEKCHKKFHDEYGYKHNNIKQLKEFLNKYANHEPSLTKCDL